MGLGIDTRETPRQVDLPVAKALGGAAPQDRRCRRILESGRQCGDWSVRGWDLCSRHGRYRGTHVERPIEVPLLEDDAAVTLVLSQAVRALAWGTIPPANGRAMVAGCRAATEVLKLRLAVARFEAQRGERAEPQVTDVEEDRGDLYSRQMSAEEIGRAYLVEREARRARESAGRQGSESAGQQGSESAGSDVSSESFVESHVCEHRADMGRPGNVPQGLKPGVHCGLNGTTESRALTQNQNRDSVSVSSVETHVCEHRADMGHPGVAEVEMIETPTEEVMAEGVAVETMVAAGLPLSENRGEPPAGSGPVVGHAVTALWRAIEADVAGEPEVEADAEWEPVVRVEHSPHFRDLKDRWERAARRFGESLADLKRPRRDEDREMWKAALRRPWDGSYPGV